MSIVLSYSVCGTLLCLPYETNTESYNRYTLVLTKTNWGIISKQLRQTSSLKNLDLNISHITLAT